MAAAIAAPLCEAQQDFSAVELSVLPVQGNVYMIAGAGGNISVQIGDEGVLVVDTQFAPLAPRIMAEIEEAVEAARPIHRQHARLMPITSAATRRSRS